MNRTPCRGRSVVRPGVTLAHILIALPLLALFTFVSTQLLLTTWRTSGELRASTEAAARLDGALHRLRADAWGATEFSVHGAAATFRYGDGLTVTWQAEPAAGRLVRTAPGAAPARWEGLPAGITFAADGASLRVTLPNAAAGRTEEVVMPSQLLLAGRQP